MCSATSRMPSLVDLRTERSARAEQCAPSNEHAPSVSMGAHSTLASPFYANRLVLQLQRRGRPVPYYLHMLARVYSNDAFIARRSVFDRIECVVWPRKPMPIAGIEGLADVACSTTPVDFAQWDSAVFRSHVNFVISMARTEWDRSLRKRRKFDVAEFMGRVRVAIQCSSATVDELHTHGA